MLFGWISVPCVLFLVLIHSLTLLLQPSYVHDTFLYYENYIQAYGKSYMFSEKNGKSCINLVDSWDTQNRLQVWTYHSSILNHLQVMLVTLPTCIDCSHTDISDMMIFVFIILPHVFIICLCPSMACITHSASYFLFYHQ